MVVVMMILVSLMTVGVVIRFVVSMAMRMAVAAVMQNLGAA